MKFLKFILLVSILVVVFSPEANAQRRRTPAKSTPKSRSTSKSKATDKKEEESLVDKLAYDIRLGNVYISNGFSISVKPSVGYKIVPRLAAGIGTRLYFDYLSYRGQEASYFTYGGFLYSRFKVTEKIFLQADYGSTRFKTQAGTTSVTYPSVGGGYMSSIGEKFSSGIEVMFPLSTEARSFGYALEYWINFSYKF